MDYGSGSSVGFWVSDSVSVGGLKLKNYTFEVMNAVVSMGGPTMDGIMGFTPNAMFLSNNVPTFQ